MMSKTYRVRVETNDGCVTFWYEKSDRKRACDLITDRVYNQLCGLNIKEVSVTPSVWLPRLNSKIAHSRCTLNQVVACQHTCVRSCGVTKCQRVSVTNPLRLTGFNITKCQMQWFIRTMCQFNKLSTTPWLLPHPVPYWKHERTNHSPSPMVRRARRWMARCWILLTIPSCCTGEDEECKYLVWWHCAASHSVYHRLTFHRFSAILTAWQPPPLSTALISSLLFTTSISSYVTMTSILRLILHLTSICRCCSLWLMTS